MNQSPNTNQKTFSKKSAIVSKIAQLGVQFIPKNNLLFLGIFFFN